MPQNLPDELLTSLEGTSGFERNRFEAVHASGQQITSVRFNAKKLKRYTASNIIHPNFNLQEKVPWCEHAFYLEERPSFTFDPLLHAGGYYVQEASSMFLWEILRQLIADDTNLKVLDLCAAPGGKSTLLASYFTNGLIVSNEVIRSRVNILYENITKWGAANVVITNNEAADFQRLNNYFDMIVVDAPCSGSGLFRKDAEAINEWSENMVELCSRRQQSILSAVYPALKDEGILIYSTCSYSPEEDEDILDYMQNKFDVESIRLKLKPVWNIIETQSKHKAWGYRFWPDKLKGEGFFVAAFKKNKSSSQNSRWQKNSWQKATSADASVAAGFLEHPSEWVLFSQNENIYAIKTEWNNDVAILKKNLYLRKAGVQIGKIKGTDLIPHHELALSTIINNNVTKFELSLEQALAYLRKKAPAIENSQKGWALSTYNHFPLGWLKILHNRVNNYYPTEWRILKD